MNVLMVAAENAALPGGKVGGIGDVIRDIPGALIALGHEVDVVIPGYQHFSRLPGARRVGAVEVRFRGVSEHVEIYELARYCVNGHLRCWVLEHPLFAPCGSGKIYCDDPPGSPFATDASKYALFCIAVLQACIEGYWRNPDILHLHDWHAALAALLVRQHPDYQCLGKLRLVYTIHNLALQGVRPFEGDWSSLRAWFPDLNIEYDLIADTRYPECVNPMRLGINLSDRVQAVSPNYAREIQAPSHAEIGFFGGEGLEDDLRRAAAEGRLKGILNGCEYPETDEAELDFAEVLDAMEAELLRWLADQPQVSNSNLLALRRIDGWRRGAEKTRPPFLMTSIGRVTGQKVALLLTEMPDGRPALEAVLECLGDSGKFVMVGSGDRHMEQQLVKISARYSNFVFLCGYAEALSDVLYHSGDLFLMPSSFEPCGISQMLAMRGGQPCLVHHVGGLVDTVLDGENGFSFSGANPQEQIQGMLAALEKALQLRNQHIEQWRVLRARAKASRFLWADAAHAYVTDLYS
jgi:starch synthase